MTSIGEARPAGSDLVRQSFDVRIPALPVPIEIEGTAHLFYELHLTNFANRPLTLQELSVIDGADDSVLVRMNGNELHDRLGRIDSRSTNSPRTVAPGQRVIVYTELRLAADAVPDAIEHRIVYRADGGATPRRSVLQAGHIVLPGDQPIVLAPPLRGGPWAAVYDPSWTRGHRRVVYAVDGQARIPGRFAIDWIRLDEGGSQARGDENKLANWYGYGADVLAVADAVVVATRDDITESATISGAPEYPIGDATGNYVALDLGQGQYAFYEHLAPGSVLVEPGDRVRRGQVIASLGFTGQTTGPHLHFHVADANSPLGAEGLPFVLDEFLLLGRYDDFSGFGKLPWTPLQGTIEAQRIRELPASNTVVSFPPQEEVKTSGDARHSRIRGE